MTAKVRTINSENIEEGLLLSLLTYFNEDEWRPSLGIAQEEAFSGFERREVSRTLHALSNPRLVEKFELAEEDTLQETRVLDARPLWVKGATSRASYKLSPIGVLIRDALLAKRKDRL